MNQDIKNSLAMGIFELKPAVENCENCGAVDLEIQTSESFYIGGADMRGDTNADSN